MQPCPSRWSKLSQLQRLAMRREPTGYTCICATQRDSIRLMLFVILELSLSGRGLFWGIELVADRQSKAPFDPKLGLAGKLKKAAFAEGLICYPMPGARDGQLGDHVLLAPPFISSEDELDDSQNRLQIALEKALSSAGE